MQLYSHNTADKVMQTNDLFKGWNTATTPPFRTKDGELSLDEKGCLIYSVYYSSFVLQLASDVDKWFYIDDSTILYRYEFSDSPHFNITDIHGNHQDDGIISESGNLVYRLGASIIKEAGDGERYLLTELPSKSTPVVFESTSYFLPQGYPYSDLVYHKYYDLDGNYLPKETKKIFMCLLLRDIECSFMHWERLDKATGSCEIPEPQRIALHRLSELREETTHLTYETINEMIRLCEESDFVDPLFRFPDTER